MAIAFDAASDENSETAGNSITWDHTVVSNTDGYIAVGSTAFDTVDSDRPVTGVTFNTDALGLVKSQNDDTLNHTVEFWGKTAPDQTTGAVVVGYTGTVTDPMGGAVSYTGVDQGSPTGATSGVSITNDDTPTLDILTTVENSYVINALIGTQASGAQVTPDSPQTLRWDFLAGRNVGGADLATTTVTTYTLAWTLPGGIGVSDWTLAAIEILPATGGAFTPVQGNSTQFFQLLGVGT